MASSGRSARIGPSTASAIAKGIDTRGIGGYVLLPPSSIDGHFYEVLDGLTFDKRNFADAPAWLLAALAKPIRFERIAPAGFVEDQEYVISWAKHLIQRAIAHD